MKDVANVDDLKDISISGTLFFDSFVKKDLYMEAEPINGSVWFEVFHDGEMVLSTQHLSDAIDFYNGIRG